MPPKLQWALSGASSSCSAVPLLPLQVATLFDDDGILIRFMNNSTQVCCSVQSVLLIESCAPATALRTHTPSSACRVRSGLLAGWSECRAFKVGAQCGSLRVLFLALQGNGIRDSSSANQLLQQVNFNGLTPLGTNLNSKVSTVSQTALLGGLSLLAPAGRVLLPMVPEPPQAE